MRALWFLLALLGLGVFGLYGWYGTLHPCEMLKKDLLRGERVVEGPAAGEDAKPGGELGQMLDQLLGETMARPVVEAWLAGKTPGECVRSLVRYHTEGEL